MEIRARSSTFRRTDPLGKRWQQSVLSRQRALDTDVVLYVLIEELPESISAPRHAPLRLPQKDSRAPVLDDCYRRKLEPQVPQPQPLDAKLPNSCRAMS